MVETPTPSHASDVISAAAALSNEEVVDELDLAFRQKAAAEGKIVVLMGEVDRRQAYRDEGATSVESWAAERFGISTPTARAYGRLGEKAWDMPAPRRVALCRGRVLRQGAAPWPTWPPPRATRSSVTRARECTVRELADVARTSATAIATPPSGRSEHERRYLRFNEAFRTMSVQLPPESFAETRACLEARARAVPSDGETPWDQRLCDAFVEMIRGVGPGRSGSRHHARRPAPTSWSSTSRSAPWSITTARRAPWPASSSATG